MMTAFHFARNEQNDEAAKTSGPDRRAEPATWSMSSAAAD